MNCLRNVCKLCADIRLTVSQWNAARRLNLADALALLLAAEIGNIRAVHELLERGVPADGPRTRRLETALFLAVENDHADVVRTLLEHGADPSVPDVDGAGAITQAAAAGNVPLITLMKRYKPEAFRKPAAVMALHKASRFHRHGTLQALLDGGAPVGVRLPNRPPVLHDAATSCATCVQILLKAGADPNCTDRRGLTALHCAASAEKLDCVRVLVEAGARVNACAADGLQPWQMTRSMLIVSLLRDHYPSQRSRLAGSTSPLPQPSLGHRSQFSPLAQSKEQLPSERIGEGALQPLQRSGSVGAAGPSDTAAPGAAPSQDASPRPAAGLSGETSQRAAFSLGAPACSAAGPSGVTSPGTSPSRNGAPATAGAEPSSESLPVLSPSLLV